MPAAALGSCLLVGHQAGGGNGCAVPVAASVPCARALQGDSRCTMADMQGVSCWFCYSNHAGDGLWPSCWLFNLAVGPRVYNKHVAGWVLDSDSILPLILACARFPYVPAFVSQYVML